MCDMTVTGSNCYMLIVCYGDSCFLNGSDFHFRKDFYDTNKGILPNKKKRRNQREHQTIYKMYYVI